MSENTQTPATPVPATEVPQTGSENQQVDQDISVEDLSLLAGEESTTQSVSVEQAKADVEKAEQNLKDAKGEKAKAEAKKQLEKAKHVYKLKVDGEEIEWEGTDEDIKRELQLAKKARKEIQTSSELKKELAEFLQILKTDPRKVLTDPAIGVDVLEFAKQIINEQIENELKSPEQIEKERLERELEELRAQMKYEQERKQQEEYERLVRQHETDLEEKMIDALNTSGLPKSPYILKRAADVMLSALEMGKDISPKQAINIVKREMNKDLKEMFAVSPDELLEELLGSDNIKRINKRQLSKIKKPVETASSIKDSGESVKYEEMSKKSEQPKKMKISDWLKQKG